jgi:hypothetical protein
MQTVTTKKLLRTKVLAVGALVAGLFHSGLAYPQTACQAGFQQGKDAWGDEGCIPNVGFQCPPNASWSALNNKCDCVPQWPIWNDKAKQCVASTAVDEFPWNGAPYGYWASDCDYPGQSDLSSVTFTAKSDDCGATCQNTENCTHFVKTADGPYGTCHMKSGLLPAPTVATQKNHYLCGVVTKPKEPAERAAQQGPTGCGSCIWREVCHPGPRQLVSGWCYWSGCSPQKLTACGQAGLLDDPEPCCRPF